MMIYDKSFFGVLNLDRRCCLVDKEQLRRLTYLTRDLNIYFFMNNGEQTVILMLKGQKISLEVTIDIRLTMETKSVIH